MPTTKEQEMKAERRKAKAYIEGAVGKIPEEATSLLTFRFWGRFKIQNLSFIDRVAISVNLLHLRK